MVTETGSLPILRPQPNTYNQISHNRRHPRTIQNISHNNMIALLFFRFTYLIAFLFDSSRPFFPLTLSFLPVLSSFQTLSSFPLALSLASKDDSPYSSPGYLPNSDETPRIRSCPRAPSKGAIKTPRWPPAIKSPSLTAISKSIVSLSLAMVVVLLVVVRLVKHWLLQTKAKRGGLRQCPGSRPLPKVSVEPRKASVFKFRLGLGPSTHLLDY